MWACDITCLPMAHGFLHLVAICVEALQEALAKHGRPGIVNTELGSQFTSDEWIKVLKDAGVRHQWRPE